MRRLFIIATVMAAAMRVWAGGPLYVAGTNGFNPGLAGTPITWAGGTVTYYTDQGDLAPLVTQGDADTMVADAFALWRSLPTVQLSATRAGQLDEDVSGDNVTRWSTLPADVMPDSGKPVAVIYDYGGKVLDALLGSGAGAVAMCDDNAVLVFHDRFTPDAHFAHALLIVNGNCIQVSQDRAVLRYRLARAIGRLLGLGWSQANDNVASGSPAPVANDYVGFPLMHPVAALCTFGGYGCTPYAQNIAPRLDDRAALGRLYPNANFHDTTARLAGTVRFPAWAGVPGQGMQGVNVVARRIENGKASAIAVASSVSGFLFRGNAGNVVTGTTSVLDVPGDCWGSTEAAVEGRYDLAGLEIPEGSATAQYELHLEAVNAKYAGEKSVGPYEITPTPSGSAAPVIVTVSRGGDVVQDFGMSGGAAESMDAREPHAFDQPAVVPAGGHWSAALSGYGDVDWHAFKARAGRSFSVEVTALDDKGAATTTKALPVIGVWNAGATSEAPPVAKATYFNAAPGITRLQGSDDGNGALKVGIADYRGDGRPDYRYVAHVLYADEVQPRRASTAGGTALTIRGIGFSPGVTVKVGEMAAEVISATADELVVQAPAASDGSYDITISDAGGATASISNAVAYGAGAGDEITIIGNAGPPAPVGAETASPVRARVTDAGGTPVEGATVTFASSNPAFLLLPCNAESCVRATDATGEARVSVRVGAAASSTISAGLKNGQHAETLVSGETKAGVPVLWAMPAQANLPQGMSAAMPLRVKLVREGVAQAGQTIGFAVADGVATVSPAIAVTDINGEAATTVSFANLAAQIHVVPHFVPDAAVVSAGLRIFVVAGSVQHVEMVSGDGQVTSGAFAPVVVRVADGLAPPNGLPGVAVKFRAVAFRPSGDESGTDNGGDLVVHRYAQEVAVGSSEATVYSDVVGHAAFTPAFPSAAGPLRVMVTASIAGSAVEFRLRRIEGIATNKITTPKRKVVEVQ